MATGDYPMGGILSGYTSTSPGLHDPTHNHYNQAITGGYFQPSGVMTTAGMGVGTSPVSGQYYFPTPPYTPSGALPGARRGQMVSFLDVNGISWNIEVDPSLVATINTLNAIHATKLNIIAPTNLVQNQLNQYRPARPVQCLPEADFSLEEMAKAEEMMEELCGAA